MSTNLELCTPRNIDVVCDYKSIRIVIWFFHRCLSISLLVCFYELVVQEQRSLLDIKNSARSSIATALWRRLFVSRPTDASLDLGHLLDVILFKLTIKNDNTSWTTQTLILSISSFWFKLRGWADRVLPFRILGLNVDIASRATVEVVIVLFV